MGRSAKTAEISRGVVLEVRIGLGQTLVLRAFVLARKVEDERLALSPLKLDLKADASETASKLYCTGRCARVQ